ncbi:methyl-accepting chemotaxis protein [Lacibacterium aquatile]|uniref:Methyl-accepting chemotaxis protein n=1 Tax=Lacibacterium aquatile TaxID=1168082 RepID=A0ABW5DSA6_9PROT
MIRSLSLNTQILLGPSLGLLGILLLSLGALLGWGGWVVAVGIVIGFAGLGVAFLHAIPAVRSQGSEITVLRDAMGEAERALTEQTGELEEAETLRRQTLQTMADRIEHETQAAVGRVAERSSRMDADAKVMAVSIGKVSGNVQSVSAAASQALSNAEAVAAATAELGGSVREIGQQVVHATEATREAVATGQTTETAINDLSQAVSRIGEIALLIQNIAAQTNLLALNATIEAARAGEAGKGFAVVAGEVKNLASQTAHSTEEINRTLNDVRSVSAQVIELVQRTGQQVLRIDEVASAIAVAIEEQMAATNEISRNVAETASAARLVATEIASVSSEANQTGAIASDVQQVAQAVAGDIADLRGAIVRAVRDSSEIVNRRETPRYPADQVCDLKVGGSTQSARISNVSRGGAMLTTSGKLPAGTRATLVLSGGDSVEFTVTGVSDGRLHIAFAAGGQALKSLLAARGVAA